MVTLKANKRDLGSDLGAMRKKGEIPAVFYGAGKASTPVTLRSVDFKKVWASSGESSTVKVSTPDGDIDVLIHEVQTDPITDEPIHVDLLVLDMNKTIKVGVPLEFTGISSVVKSGVGTLVKVLYEIEIEALPKDLPHNLVVDISSLNTLEDQILVKDIVLPKGVVPVTPLEEVVCSIAEQKEVVETESQPIDLSAIEVEKKGKKEEEGASSEEKA